MLREEKSVKTLRSTVKCSSPSIHRVHCGYVNMCVLGPPGRYLSGISPHGEVFLLLLLLLHRTACRRFSLRWGYFFSNWNCSCDFWYAADPESSVHESPALRRCTDTSPAGLLCTPGRFISLQDIQIGRDLMSSGETGWLQRQQRHGASQPISR